MYQTALNSNKCIYSKSAGSYLIHNLKIFSATWETDAANEGRLRTATTAEI